MTLLEDVEELQRIYLARATGGAAAYDEFEDLRRSLSEHPTVGPLLPPFVREYRYIEQFWQHVKRYAPDYATRRDYVWKGFQAALDAAERGNAPHHDGVSDTLADPSGEQLQAAWSKALARQRSDPEGAITAARALLESVCKLILDETGTTYGAGDDLPKLYRHVAEILNLAPSQHSEELFKRVLGGCQSVVEGIGGIRNRLGDAHGQGKRPIRPSPRHAVLVVNLAGTMAEFLAATWREGRGHVA